MAQALVEQIESGCSKSTRRRARQRVEVKPPPSARHCGPIGVDLVALAPVCGDGRGVAATDPRAGGVDLG